MSKCVVGTFGKKEVLYRIFRSRKARSKQCFVIFHGVFGSSYKSEKYGLLVDGLRDWGSVVVYQTSRNQNSWEKSGDWEEYKQAFVGKTFQQELDDVIGVFEQVARELSKKVEFVFVGFSLGGTLSSYLLPKYGKRVATVFLFGSGVTTKGADEPILSTYPNKELILKNYDGFEGKVILVQGTEDTRVPMEEAREVIWRAEKAGERQLILLRGIDHAFMCKYGVEASEEITGRIVGLIRHNL